MYSKVTHREEEGNARIIYSFLLIFLFNMNLMHICLYNCFSIWLLTFYRITLVKLVTRKLSLYLGRMLWILCKWMWSVHFNIRICVCSVSNMDISFNSIRLLLTSFVFTSSKFTIIFNLFQDQKNMFLIVLLYMYTHIQCYIFLLESLSWIYLERKRPAKPRFFFINGLKNLMLMWI